MSGMSGTRGLAAARAAQRSHSALGGDLPRAPGEDPSLLAQLGFVGLEAGRRDEAGAPEHGANGANGAPEHGANGASGAPEQRADDDDAQALSRSVTSDWRATLCLEGAMAEAQVLANPGKTAFRGHKAMSYVLQPHELEGRWGQVKALVRSQRFDYMVGALIALNSVVLGIETDHRKGDNEDHVGWVVVEGFFLFVFTTELLLRLSVYSPPIFLQDSWCLFDLGLVVAAWANVVVAAMPQSGDKDLRVITVLRIFRLLRLGRMLRLFRVFHELYMLMTGVMRAFKTMIWTSTLLCLLLYAGAIFMTQIVSGLPAEAQEGDDGLVDRWGSVSSSMLSLFQVMTLESWSEKFLRPLLLQGRTPWIWVFFVGFLVVTTFAVLNIVAAIIVETTFSQVQSDEIERGNALERERAVLCRLMQHIFVIGDVSGDGVLTREEFEDAVGMPEVQDYLVEAGITKEKALELFELLDADGSHDLSLDEFTLGLLRMKGDARTRDLITLQFNLHLDTRKLTERVSGLERDMHEQHRQLDGKLLALSTQVSAGFDRLYESLRPTAPAPAPRAPVPPPGQLPKPLDGTACGGPPPAGDARAPAGDAPPPSLAPVPDVLRADEEDDSSAATSDESVHMEAKESMLGLLGMLSSVKMMETTEILTRALDHHVGEKPRFVAGQSVVDVGAAATKRMSTFSPEIDRARLSQALDASGARALLGESPGGDPVRRRASVHAASSRADSGADGDHAPVQKTRRSLVAPSLDAPVESNRATVTFDA